MALVDVLNTKNEKVGQVEISDNIMTYPVKPWLIHEVVKMQLACRRAGTHATLNRALIEGGGRKPWKQKGTGRARAGSIRSPLWRGGAVIFGPQPRDYSYSMPKKKVKNALRSAVKAKFDDAAVKIVDNFVVESGKTKDAQKLLDAMGLSKRVLIVYSEIDDKTFMAFRNLPKVDFLNVKGLNVYDVVNADNIIIVKDALSYIMEVLD
ncbi:50S ribosomal protein L4 [Calditerrivibrio nitroreducens]|uniref:Large ribosomal subunit protein uL4 n=1 Tax=Calditerrivibrio nitroreducens (strain DSM 19672 / NBRC 101217 / Yu37-1) TaxID=768670 RepID=E4TEQ7_CALNY|nr:50S ribosomal protein L4 [Calditerrivibrio nitroreducens]ADR19414.1 ribosomal protein L4/L1e [Calditerrivibrio nitroreducens DSM 19672]